MSYEVTLSPPFCSQLRVHKHEAKIKGSVSWPLISCHVFGVLWSK